MIPPGVTPGPASPDRRRSGHEANAT
jgi:hypothetical protein